MERFPKDEQKSVGQKIGDFAKDALMVGGAAGVALGVMTLKDGIDESEKDRVENPRNSLEQVVGDVHDLSEIKNNENIGKDFKFYFHSNIHEENGIKWVRLIAQNNTNYNVVTANSAIINFLEQNPEEDNAFLRKNESGQLELVKESGEVAETF